MGKGSPRKDKDSLTQNGACSEKRRILCAWSRGAGWGDRRLKSSRQRLDGSARGRQLYIERHWESPRMSVSSDRK